MHPGPILQKKVIQFVNDHYDDMVREYGKEFTDEAVMSILQLHNGCREMHNMEYGKLRLVK